MDKISSRQTRKGALEKRKWSRPTHLLQIGNIVKGLIPKTFGECEPLQQSVLDFYLEVNKEGNELDFLVRYLFHS